MERRSATRPRTFINSFDATHDRVALLTFGNGAKVLDPMPPTRGFDKIKVDQPTCPSTLPGGSTNMVEGLYRGWDELRSVPAGTQSGLRVIVLFTDGASNSVPGDYGTPASAKGAAHVRLPAESRPTRTARPGTIRTSTGLYDTQTGAQRRSAIDVATGTTSPHGDPTTASPACRSACR